MSEEERTGEADRQVPDAVPGPDQARRRRLVRGLLGIALVVILLDLVTKQMAITALSGGERVRVLGDLLSLHLVYNPGAAFSLAAGTTWIFTVIALAVVVVILRVARRLGSGWWTLALGLLLGGATGNLLDRLFRPPAVGQGHVVDFIDYAGFFVGNIADVAIVCASFLIVAITLTGRSVAGSRHTRESRSA